MVVGYQEPIRKVPLKERFGKYVVMVIHDELVGGSYTNISSKVYGVFRTYKRADEAKRALFEDRREFLSRRGDGIDVFGNMIGYKGINYEGEYTFRIEKLKKF